MSSYTLLTAGGSHRAFKILIAAKHNEVEMDVPEFNFPTENKTKAYLKKKSNGKNPNFGNSRRTNL